MLSADWPDLELGHICVAFLSFIYYSAVDLEDRNLTEYSSNKGIFAF